MLFFNIFEERLQIKLTDVLEIDIIELSKAKRQLKKGTFEEIESLRDWIKFLINPLELEESNMEDLNEEVKKAYEIWQSLNVNAEEREAAERRYKDLASLQYGMEYEYNLGRKKGLEEGIEKGEKERAKRIAKEMLKKNYKIEEIVELTGLTKEEIEDLNNK